MSFTRLRYHIVFATKNRRRYLKDEVESFVHDTLCARAEQLDCRVLEVGGIPDHVHLVSAIRPSVAVSNFVAKLKAVSSGKVSREFPSSHADFGWQQGYSAFTLFPSQVNDVCEYVRNQKEHHRRETLRDVLEQIET